MFVLGALLFMVAEVAAFVAVGEYIGFGWAVAIVIGVSALGPFVIRRVGLGVWFRAQDRLAQGDVPTSELLDGVVVLVGGVMICVPGFLGDTLGLLLMIGPVRHLVIRAAGHRLARRIRTMRPVRATVIDVESQPAAADTPPPLRPPQRVTERRRVQ